MMNQHNLYHFIKVWCGTLTVSAFLLSTSIHAQETKPQPEISRQQWQAQLGWETTDCPLESPAAPNSGIQVFELAPNLALIQVQCQLLTYQATYFFYLKKDAQVTQQKFQQFESLDVGQLEAYTSPMVTGLPAIQAKKKALYILRKYRGYGDCGQYLEYRLVGSKWVLKQLRVNECAEVFSEKVIPPQNWPIRKMK